MTARRQMMFWLAGFLAFGLLVFLLRQILLPFVAGMAVAYLFDPIADKLEDMGLSRTMATVVITALFMAITLGALVLLLPVLYHQALDLFGRAPAIVGAVRDYVSSLSETLFETLAPIRSNAPARPWPVSPTVSSVGRWALEKSWCARPWPWST